MIGNYILIYIILFCNLEGFYLFDSEYKFFNLFDFNDLTFMLNIIAFVIFLLKAKGLEKIKYNFGLYIIMFLLLTLTSSIQSYVLFNQNILPTILQQKKIICFSLLYFPLNKLIYYKKIDIEKLYKIINNLALLQLVLFISQYFLGNNIQFLHVNRGIRYGEIRYYFNPILIDLILIKNLNEFINGNNKKTKNALIIVLSLFEVMIVQKYRLTTIGLILIIIFGILICKTKSSKKFLFITLMTIFAIFMFNTKLVQDFILEFTSDSKTYTYNIRETGRQLYLDFVGKHIVLGGGYPLNESALMTSGYYNNIYLGDNGIFGFMYMYGCFGLLIVTLLWKKFITLGVKIFKNKNNLVYLLFPLFFVLTSVNELHWYWQSGFVILIMFILLTENKIRELSE